MKQLYAEVNEMKQYMAQLKQGGVIGEMFGKTDALKAERLQDLKKQRLDLEEPYKDTQKTLTN